MDKGKRVKAKGERNDLGRATLGFIILLLAAFTTSTPARAAMEVLACEPEWAALVTELAGDKVSVSSATTARQDPHRIEARPSLLAKARRADLLVCTGAELEIGWLPILQRESGNPKINTGRDGHFEAAAYAEIIERPAQVDRSLGDIHAAGNPHVHLTPYNVARVAPPLAERLARLDPANAAHYAARAKDFLDRWQTAIRRWEQAAAPLKGTPVTVHHKDLVYLTRWLGLEIVATLEPKPGIDPSAAYLAELVEQLKRKPAKLLLRTNFQSARPSEWVAERTGARVVALPYTVGGSEQSTDLFAWMDDVMNSLLGALR